MGCCNLPLAFFQNVCQAVLMSLLGGLARIGRGLFDFSTFHTGPAFDRRVTTLRMALFASLHSFVPAMIEEERHNFSSYLY